MVELGHSVLMRDKDMVWILTLFGIPVAPAVHQHPLDPSVRIFGRRLRIGEDASPGDCLDSESVDDEGKINAEWKPFEKVLGKKPIKIWDESVIIVRPVRTVA